VIERAEPCGCHEGAELRANAFIKSPAFREPLPRFQLTEPEVDDGTVFAFHLVILPFSYYKHASPNIAARERCGDASEGRGVR
jgi:hypothetical protein